jgi:hypothetical protein
MSKIQYVVGEVSVSNLPDTQVVSGSVDIASLDQYTPVSGRLPVDPSGVTSPIKIEDKYGWVVEATPMDELRVISPIRLVGSTFVGTTIDTNFWAVTNANGGTTTQTGGAATLKTNTTGGGSTILQSVKRGRYTGGSANRFRGQVELGDVGVAGNVRRWGCFDGTDGAYFKLSGTTLSACTMKAGAETAVASASWNGSTTVPTLTDVFSCEIYYTNAKVYFTIAGVLKHTASFIDGTWTDTTNLPVRIDNINTVIDTNQEIAIRVATVYRLGNLETDTTSRFIDTNTTTVCKYGAGRLHSILNCDNAGAVTVYDNTAGSGTVMATVDSAKVLGNWNFHCPFSIGLAIVTSGGAKVAVMYE